MPDIISPTVIMLLFEKHNDEWVAKIPHAYGKGEHYYAPISDKLSFQFQPRELTSLDNEHTTDGVVCYPLIQVEEK